MGNLKTESLSRLKPGKHNDGKGLYLVVRKGGSRQWVFRMTLNHRRLEKGLGGYPKVSLTEARRKAKIERTQFEDGIDSVLAPTFREATEQYLKANAPRWKHPKTAAQTRASLETYAYPAFGDRPIDRIRRGDVMTVLETIWLTKSGAAKKLRQRLRGVFVYALGKDWIETNPIDDALNAALPTTPKVKAHFRALPHADVRAALVTVDESMASLSVRLCMRFIVLTAARSGEARGATWDEIDLNARTWTIPAERMKANRLHRVPLSDAAVDVLERVVELTDGQGVLFPSVYSKDKPLSDMTLTKVLRTTGLAQRATVHGFRTSFRTWCMEETTVPWAVGESALAHNVGNSTEAAYARSDLFNRRRELMQQWADYLNVVQIAPAIAVAV
jgi:integrase